MKSEVGRAGSAISGVVKLRAGNSCVHFLLGLFSCISASILARTSQKAQGQPVRDRRMAADSVRGSADWEIGVVTTRSSFKMMGLRVLLANKQGETKNWALSNYIV